MKAILIKEFGAPENMYLGETDLPELKEQYILVKVQATALNRADTLQRAGMYPPPPGASPILGLEIAGLVHQVGGGVTKWKEGDLVFGLIPGGGYAEYALIHQDMAITIPEGMSYEQAAAIPEVFLTAYQALIWLARLQENERVLIHAGASGVGTAAIQIARAWKAQVFCTASAAKHSLCKELGAQECIDYKNQDFKEIILKRTQDKGVNIIIDFIAAAYFQKNLAVLGMDGRLVLLALLGGIQVNNFNMATLLRKRLSLMGSTLRARALDYQIKLSQDFWNFAESRFQAGELKPIIDSVLDWQDVVDGHKKMEANLNAGKIILKVT
ncbi:MAG: NAD(P)H-quinone oxidoreductase [Bacteroidota bacterium]